MPKNRPINISFAGRRHKSSSLVVRYLDRTFAVHLFCFIVLFYFILGSAEAQLKSTVNSFSNGAAPYLVAENGSDYRIWNHVVTLYSFPNRSTVKTNFYKEMATGLNTFRNGEWVPASEEIQISVDRQSAAATNAQHAVNFAGNVNSLNAIQLTAPDGALMKSHIMGLSYYDPESDKSVLIAELQDSSGQVLPPNQILYTNAFTDFEADVRYTFTIHGLEQDIILRQQPPSPSQWSLGSKTRLQIWTEFTEAPTPVLNSTTNESMSMIDQALDFGTMHMNPGKAFKLGEAGLLIPVAKSWKTISGRTFLIEEMPLNSIVSEIEDLPSTSGTTGHQGNQTNLTSRMVVNSLRNRLFPHPVLAPRKAQSKSSSEMKIASTIPKREGFVLDYNLILNGNLTNFVFQSDTTYFITNLVSLYGSPVVEGATVIKFASNSSASLSLGNSAANLIWKTSAYRPAIFTGKDDDSVGTQISGSTSSPTNHFYGLVALNLTAATNAVVTGATFSFLNAAITATNATMRDIQVNRCQTFMAENGHTGAVSLSIFNALACNIGTCFDFTGSSGTQNIVCANLTIHSSSNLISNPGSFMGLTNCLLVCVTNISSPTTFVTNHCAVLTNDTGIFQSVGAGNHYLASASPYQNAGTTNGLDSSLIATLPQRTTYPPSILNVNVTTNTVLSPVVPRDTNSSPDMGYHYPPIDYLTTYCQVTGCNLYLTNGVTIAYYDAFGIWLENGGNLISVSTPLAENSIVYYRLIQEQATNLWSWSTNNATYAVANSTPILFFSSVLSNYPSVNLQFTTIDAANGAAWFLSIFDGNSAVSSLNVTNCEMYAAGGSYVVNLYNTGPPVVYKNNLWHRPFEFYSENTNATTSINNLFVGDGGANTIIDIFCTTTGSFPDTNYNNAFDGCKIYIDGHLSNNAYLNSNVFNGMTAESSSVVTNLAWVTGPLGYYYQPTNSPILNKGYTNAAYLGLYDYTVLTNQVPETTNKVSIGYHYVAVGTNGFPLDLNSNGIPDYLENAFGPVPPYILIQPTNQTVVVGATTNFMVTAAGPAPLFYQWYFNTTNALSGATNATLTLVNISPSQAGNYDVVVTNLGGSVQSSNATLSVLSPTVISGMRLWLRADAGVSNNISGFVTNWSDQSGNINNATGAGGPTLVTNVLNGMPIIRFNGSDSFFNLPDFMPSTTATQGEAFAVMRSALILATNSTVPVLWSIGQGDSGGYPDLSGGISDNFGSSQSHFMGMPAQKLTNFYIFNSSSATNDWSARINGVLINETNKNTVSFTNTPRIGWTLTGDDKEFNGDIAEIIIYNRVLTQTERDTVGNYLNARYNLVQAPAVPTSLTALAISSNQISLVWNAVLTSTNINFKVEKSIGNTNSFNQVSVVRQGCSYIDTGLTNGVNYYYRIKASNLTGDSAYTSVVSTTTSTGTSSLPLTNIVTWLKGDAGNTGGLLCFWADQSGNTNHATGLFTGPLSSIYYPWTPSIQTNSINGRAVAYCNGSSVLNLQSGSLNGLAQAEAVVVLCAITNPPLNPSLWELGGSADAELFPSQGGSDAVPPAGMINEDFGSTQAYVEGYPISSIYTPNIYDVYSMNNDWAARFNGVLQFATNWNIVSFPNNPTVGVPGQGFYGQIAEVLIFNRVLAQGERMTLGAYLVGKYGISISTPPPPTNVLAAAVSQQQINLTISGIATNVSYTTIERKTGATGNYTQIGILVTNAPSVLVDTIVSPTNQYYYRVISYNFAGPSTAVMIAPPTALITSPVSSTPFNMGSNVNVAISAADPDGTVTEVDLYNDLVRLGTLTNGPYNFTVTLANASYFSLSAKVTDNQGNTRFSNLISLPLYQNTSGDGRNDGLDISLGLDPTNTNNVPFNPLDTNAPIITLLQPTNATPVP